MLSTKSFFSKIIDYAGLFPPAKLPLEEALENYTQYRSAPTSWMLSRFICPVVNLDEISIKKELLEEGEEWLFSALVALMPGQETKSWSEALSSIQSFQKKYSGRVMVTMVESKLPSFSEPSQLLSFWKEISEMAKPLGQLLSFFWEVPLEEEFSVKIPILLEALAQNKKENPESPVQMGIKVRTGGVDAKMFPSAKLLAQAIFWAKEYQVPLKATAGLHHPYRHYSSTVETKMYGFMNVFGAALLAREHSWSESQIQEMLEDEDPKNFYFEEESFTWKEYTMSSESIAKARSSSIISFGSCSFEEPCQDLQELGIIEVKNV